MGVVVIGNIDSIVIENSGRHDFSEIVVFDKLNGFEEAATQGLLADMTRIVMLQNGFMDGMPKPEQISTIRDISLLCDKTPEIIFIVTDKALEQYISKQVLNDKISVLYRDFIDAKIVLPQVFKQEEKKDDLESRRSEFKEGRHVNANYKTIVVCSLHPDCGSTFITMNIAGILDMYDIASAVIEYPENIPVVYTYLNGFKTAPDDWKSLLERYHKNMSVSNSDFWKDDNITWFPLKETDKEIPLNRDLIYSCLMASRGVSSVSFIDVSTNWDSDNLKSTFDTCSEIWCVFKPNPAKFETTMGQFLKHMDNWASKIKFVGNMSSDYVKRKRKDEMEDYIKHYTENKVWSKSSIDALIPYLDVEAVSLAEWKGTLAVREQEILTSEVREAFNPLVKSIVSNIDLTKDIDDQSSNKGLFGGLFKRRG